MYVLLEQRNYIYYDNTKDVNVYVEYKSDKKENVEAMKLIKEEEAKLLEQDKGLSKELVYQIVELVN
tara:strand:+ start:255 stop:455 length:201 start_codon:yes stop_codon:yes gene_type:complete